VRGPRILRFSTEELARLEDDFAHDVELSLVSGHDLAPLSFTS
jgi:hypothetical protein